LIVNCITLTAARGIIYYTTTDRIRNTNIEYPYYILLSYNIARVSIRVKYLWWHLKFKLLPYRQYYIARCKTLSSVVCGSCNHDRLKLTEERRMYLQQRNNNNNIIMSTRFDKRCKLIWDACAVLLNRYINFVFRSRRRCEVL